MKFMISKETYKKIKYTLNIYTERINDLYEKTIKNQKENYPEFKVDFVKIEHSPITPNKKKPKIRKKIYKKLERENKFRPDAMRMEIKSIKSGPEEEIIDEILKDKKLSGAEYEIEKIKIATKLDSVLKNYHNNFKRSFNEAFSLFENMNNEIMNNLRIIDKIYDRSVFGLDDLREKFLTKGIDLSRFEYWDTLNEFHLMRNSLTHKDGLIDQKYIDKSRFRDNNDLGREIFVYEELFRSLIYHIFYYIEFITFCFNEF